MQGSDKQQPAQKAAKGQNILITPFPYGNGNGIVPSRASSTDSQGEPKPKVIYWVLLLSILIIIGVITVGIILVYLIVASGMDKVHQDLQKTTAAAQSQVQYEHVKIERKEVSEPKSSAKTEGKLGLNHNHHSGKPSKGTRRRRSALLSSSSNPAEGSSDPERVYRHLMDGDIDRPRTECRKRSLPMCARTIPFNSTTYPNLIGDDNEIAARRSLPFFNLIAKSGCNRRLRQLLCILLEPPCLDGRALPPCKKFCRVALEGCAEYIPATLELSSVFDCRQYPDSIDPSVCINLASGRSCANDEYQCPDKSCIPKHWVCDGVRDCIFAADETNCTRSDHSVASVCSTEEFQCDGKCVPMTWRCDGDRDCLDGTDEQNCSYRPSCGPDRFKCHDGFGCIPKRWVCDGKSECRDGSDESGCSQRECSRGDFKCDNGICIPNIWVCDGGDDCKDNSDERSCSNRDPNQMNSLLSAAASAPAVVAARPPQVFNQPGVANANPGSQVNGQPIYRPQHLSNSNSNNNNNNNNNNGQNIEPPQNNIGPYSYFNHNNVYRWVHR